MLKALRHHPLMVGTAEVLVDAARYVAIMLVVFLLLGQLAKVSCSIWQFTGSEGLDEAYVPFFGAFGAAWDDAMVAHCSASPLGMPLAGDGRCVLGVRWEWRPASHGAAPSGSDPGGLISDYRAGTRLRSVVRPTGGK
jgi:hypothetical protein